MIKSMTGFGSAKGVSGKLQITVDVKSVNNKLLDCSIKIPRVYACLEESLKAIVTAAISRGKIDISVYIDSSNADDIEVKPNHSLAKAYIDALREIARENNLHNDVTLSDISRFPDILQAARREIDVKSLSADIGKVLSDALTIFNNMRIAEGEKLKNDLQTRLEIIETLTGRAEELSPQTVTEYRNKLEIRMKEVLESITIDEARILTEAAIFADRVAINEEIVRLRSHITQLRELLSSNEPVGRKIDFLVQEMNREANTIGSKGNNAHMAKIVVELKSEIEKIREQGMNIE